MDQQPCFPSVREKNLYKLISMSAACFGIPGELVKYGKPTVVEFSCSFFQTISSIAFGRCLKQAFPDVKLVFGGPCFHGGMGEELIRKVPWIDAVSTGEADDVIIPLFRALSDGRSPSGLHGILYREKNGDVISGKPAKPVSKEILESLPDADYSDYFRTLDKVGLSGAPGLNKLSYLLFEGSRGCWWGQKKHCLFCGLNAEGMEHRAKTGERVFQTIANYVQKYPMRRFHATDNNFSMKYFKTLFPKLKNSSFKDRLSLYFEVKVNLTRNQVREMSRAGVLFVQPGIESLSTHILDLLLKGATSLLNIYFLKLCREYNIFTIWNNLIRVPGEKIEDYKEMEALIPKIIHLSPPCSSEGTRFIECHRFSPYFSEKDRWLTNLRPMPWYKALFPSDKIDLSRIAYYFEADWKDTLDEGAYNAVTAMCRKWNRIWSESKILPGLYIHENEDKTLFIEDSRTEKAKTHRLDHVSSFVYRAISDPGNLRKVGGRVKKMSKKSLSDERISLILRKFVTDSLAIEEKGKYCGLAIPEGVTEPLPQLRALVYTNRN
ncbi:MAG: RiPP maturation radical SAM protein 1 [Desulfobacteraceae bacterium]|nr:RiPP maturation radical SAM protein 1 [Desulfobacteraceae bacterium]